MNVYKALVVELMYVGSHFDDFDGFLMLSHFKRHMMIKNI